MTERRDSISAAEERQAAGTPVALPPAASHKRSRRSPHAHKFLAATAILIGFAVGALGIAVVVLLNDSRPAQAGKWSAWSPPDSGLAGEREIAAAISPFYRAAPASQLVIITVRNVAGASTGTTGSGTSTQIALRDPATGSLGALSGTTALYNLCGLGPNCAIASGTPSTARMLLLRREALELALYTFKYIGGVDNVLAILPPGHTESTQSALTPAPPSPGRASAPKTSTIDLAVLLQRQALQRYLGQPLRQTLPEPLPPTVEEMPQAPEAELVSVLTSQTLFQQRTVQAQDGSNVLVLDPLPPQ